ncbi:serine/threonine-protein kinase [Nakamurella endophytica]|uniref:serine/threonine-protein kinase n=1 Tax=Nakamurella endophytica TaxID=1748367 RepID=UPI0027E45431|nr:serine/threonine-protein kinase [Nakamurella endophytica]
MALTPGLLLSDRYRLARRIAVGGMGDVWAADDTRLARRVAVKILRSELTSDPEFVDRFRSEARITASLNHPGIAAVYDYGEVASIAGGPRDTAYLVMELVSGEPLSAVLVRTPRLSVPRTLDVLEQSGRALQAAHARSLVHRDIKPGNLLITPAGQVKITDFGIAKVAHQVPVTRGGLVMGTAQYLSPEQAAGHEALPASDVYALGVVAYECLAGRRPFVAENPLAVAMAQVHDQPPPLPPDVPPPVAALVLRMLAKNPAARFRDGASLAAAVAAVRSGVTPAAAAVAVHDPRTGGLVPVPGPAGRAAGTPVRPLPGRGPAAAFGPAPEPLGPVGPVRPVVPGLPVVRPAPRRTGAAVVIALLILLAAAVAGILLVTTSRQDSGAPASGARPAAAPVAAPETSAGPGAATATRSPGDGSAGAGNPRTHWGVVSQVARTGGPVPGCPDRCARPGGGLDSDAHTDRR